MKILVVQEERAIADALAEFLYSQGHQVLPLDYPFEGRTIYSSNSKNLPAEKGWLASDTKVETEPFTFSEGDSYTAQALGLVK